MIHYIVQDSVPEGTLLVYHTEHIPVQTSDPGKWETDEFLFQHVAQLNAAGRQEPAAWHSPTRSPWILPSAICSQHLCLSHVSKHAPVCCYSQPKILQNMADRISGEW